MTVDRFLRSLLRPHRRRLVTAVALGSAANLAGAALLAVAVFLLSAAALRPPILHLTVAIVTVRALALVRAGTRYAERLTTHDTAFRLLADLRERVYRWVVPRSPSRLPAEPHGDVLGRIVHDVDAVEQLLIAGVVPVAAAGITALGTVAAVAVLAPEAAAVLAAGLAVSALALRSGGLRGATDDGVAFVGRRGAHTAGLVAFAETAPELAYLGAASTVMDHLRTEGGRIDAALARQRRTLATHTAHTLLVAGATTAAVLWLAAAATTAGRLDGRALGAVVVLAMTSFELTATVSVGLERLTEARAAAGRLLALAPERSGPQRPAPASPRPLRPAVTLGACRLAVRRQGRSTLADVSFVLSPGRPVAVVGRSGSGKTTLTHVLAGLLDPTTGHVCADGEPVDAQRCRELVALAGQEAHVFPTSLAVNLRIAAPTASDADLVSALARVRLGVWLEQLPAGLETVVGEHGVGLSAGQARRVALARALLADRAVLVLDEPTADLDPLTAAVLLDDVLALAAERAVLVLSHDVALLDRFHELLVLDHGRVVQRGSPAALEAAGGFYAHGRELSRIGGS